MTYKSFSVIIDTREKHPWLLNGSSIIGTEYRKLDTGDYTVSGLEDKICIERKKTVNEIASNITQKRFKNELQRMVEFPYRFILLESSMQKIIEYPRLENLHPKIISKIRINGLYLLKCLNRMQIKYGVNIICCGNTSNAQIIAINLMQEIVDIYDKSNTG